MKVLNLYSGIGGNRKLWTDVDVTAVEMNEEIAAIYQEYFPEDKMVIGDAHEYLLKHYKEFDFIWSSPPCQTHSRARFWGSKGGMCDVKYPDVKLWQEILLLRHYADCKWVVENVKPFYAGDLDLQLMKHDAEFGRHLFWSNIQIRTGIEFEDGNIQRYKVKEFQDLHGLEVRGKKISQRRDQILRNCVNPDLGLYILEQARGIIRESKNKQQVLF